MASYRFDGRFVAEDFTQVSLAGGAAWEKRHGGAKHSFVKNADRKAARRVRAGVGPGSRICQQGGASPRARPGSTLGSANDLDVTGRDE